MISKDEVRKIAYQRLKEAGAARFPFPIDGRIPNFRGAEAAAERLRALPVYQRARAVKVNPDAPQLPVRAMALRDGKVLYMPSPRLRGAFVRLRPEDVPPDEIRKAVTIQYCRRYGVEVRLGASGSGFEGLDLVVAGSVAVTLRGARAGKGEGYSDLEYAILRELGHGEIPVATTVHPAQIVDELPVEPHDLSVDFVVTPDEAIETHTPYPKPAGIDWGRLTEEDLRAMPVLQELRRVRWEALTVADVIGSGLAVLFVGLNPGRWSAARGHHFAGPANHFWRLLHEAGFTPERLSPDRERELLRHGIGITNVVSRASRGETDLSWEELVAGGATLREKVARFRPRVVALLGLNVYRAYAGLGRGAAVQWGLQERQSVPGVLEFAAANPSSRGTVPYGTRLDQFRTLRAIAFARPAAGQ